MAKSQPILIASQCGRSIRDREKSTPAFSIWSLIAFENGLVAVRMDVSTAGVSSVDSGSRVAQHNRGCEETKCVRHTTGLAG